MSDAPVAFPEMPVASPETAKAVVLAPKLTVAQVFPHEPVTLTPAALGATNTAVGVNMLGAPPVRMKLYDCIVCGCMVPEASRQLHVDRHVVRG